MDDRTSSLGRAARALERAEARIRELEQAAHAPIAIVGMACRFPGGAHTPRDFWRLLEEKRDAITDIPRSRWDPEEYFDPTPGTAGKTYVRQGGFVADVECFDPEFFGISVREAQSIDPQQRMLLEVSWEAIEDSGRAPASLRGTDVGVFVGIASVDWSDLASQLPDRTIGPHQSTGTSPSVAAGRLAFVMGLTGPAMAISTACSSSLVAVHLACESLRRRECSAALAGGVNALLTPRGMLKFSMTRMLSLDGRCKAFDARADGYVRGEGCGIVVLKRLSDALSDGDRIHAVIRGSGVNQDGRTQGLTVPSGVAQADVIRRALRQARVGPNEVSYVEAHGTGTALGDPIEVEAIATVYGKPPRSAPLPIGSVKTNLGHLEAAAGIAGLMKVVLALEHERIPAQLHFTKPNPRIDMASLGITIASEAMPWPRTEGPRKGAVSSFGFSGTNAHVILEEAPTDSLASAKKPPDEAHVLCLSAHTEAALRQEASKMLRRLAGSDVALEDVCWSQNTVRSGHPHRLAVLGTSRADIVRSLTETLRGRRDARVITDRAEGRPKVAFLFPAEDASFTGSAVALYEHEPSFREVFDRCAAAARREPRELLRPERTAGRSAELLRHVVAFSLESALAALWRSWGVEPTLVCGHGVGAYVAASVAGVLAMEDALRLVLRRADLVGSAPEARAILVHADRDAIAHLLRPRTAGVAVVHHRGATTLTGEARAIEEMGWELESEGIRYEAHDDANAAHSPLLGRGSTSLEDEARGIPHQTMNVSIVDARTGALVDPTVSWPAHWRAELEETVRMDLAACTLARLGCEAFFEIGPSGMLARARRAVETAPIEGDRLWLPSMPRSDGAGGREEARFSLARAYARGVGVDWDRVMRWRACRRIELPAYSFQRRRFSPPRAERRARTGTPTASSHPIAPTGHPLLREESLLLETKLGPTLPPLIEEHRIFGGVVVAAATQIAMVVEALTRQTPSVVLEDLVFLAPLRLVPGVATRVRLAVSTEPRGMRSFRISSCREDEADPRWTTHSEGRVSEARALARVADRAPAERANDLPPGASATDFYARFVDRGYGIGPPYRWLEEMWLDEGEGVARMRRATPRDLADGFRLHPGLLDSCSQLQSEIQARQRQAAYAEGDLYVPFRVDRFSVFSTTWDGELWCHARTTAESATAGVTEMRLMDVDGKVLVHAEGVQGRRVKRHQLGAGAVESGWIHGVTWERIPTNGEEPRTERADRVTWLLGRDDGWAGEATGELRRRGRPGLVVELRGHAAYDVEGWRRTIRELLSSAKLRPPTAGTLPPLSIVHLSALDRTADDRSGARALLALAKALTELDTPVEVVVVTAGAHLIGKHAVDHEQAPTWGLARVIRRECSSLRVRTIDLDPDVDRPTATRELIDELLHDHDEHASETAVRQGRRLAPIIKPMSLSESESTLEIRGHTSFLVTGGTGALGTKTAEYLVARGARHVVLTSRRGESAANDASLKALRASGARVVVESADVADETAMHALITRFGREWPPLRGVVHAAGTIRDAALRNQTDEGLTSVMSAKVDGARILHALTSGLPLDFFVLYSSSTALLGTPGQANYAAGNAYLDALAAHRASLGLPVTSIQWGPWVGAGLAASGDGAVREQRRARGVVELEPSDAMTIFGAAVASRVPVVAVMRVDWDLYLGGVEPHAQGPLRGLAGADAKAPAKGSDARADEGDAFVTTVRRAQGSERRRLLLESMERLVRKALMTERSLDPRAALWQMGMDSLMMVDLAARIRRLLGLPIPVTRLFDFGTIDALVDYLVVELDRAGSDDGAPGTHQG